MLGRFEGVEVAGERTRWIVQVFVHCGAVGTQKDLDQGEADRSPQSEQQRFSGIKYCILGKVSLCSN